MSEEKSSLRTRWASIPDSMKEVWTKRRLEEYLLSLNLIRAKDIAPGQFSVSRATLVQKRLAAVHPKAFPWEPALFKAYLAQGEDIQIKIPTMLSKVAKGPGKEVRYLVLQVGQDIDLATMEAAVHLAFLDDQFEEYLNQTIDGEDELYRLLQKEIKFPRTQRLLYRYMVDFPGSSKDPPRLIRQLACPYPNNVDPVNLEVFLRAHFMEAKCMKIKCCM